MDIRAILAGLAFALIWSSAFTSARIIVTNAPPLSVSALRFLIAGVIAVALARALGQSWRITRSQWRLIILFGVCQNALYLGLNFIAMQTIEASLAAIIASSLPLLVALAGWLFTGDKTRPLGVIGLFAGLASLILTHSWDGEVAGLNDFVAEDGTALHPPVAPVFWSFRIMVGTGMAMLALSWAGAYYLRRRGADDMPRILLMAFSAMAFSGWIATLAGWYTTEIGRQPWLVQGVMTTKQAVADVPAPMVLSTLIAYLAVYAALIVAYMGTITYLAWKNSKGEPLSTRTYPRSGEAEVRAIPGE